MAENERKTALSSELALARRRVAVNFHALGRDLDFPTRAKRAFARQPFMWIGGASFIGLILARFLFGRKKVVVVEKSRGRVKEDIEKVEKAGLLLGVLKIVFNLVRPALTAWATRFLTEYAHKKMGTAGKV